jgi:hypothetical protein
MTDRIITSPNPEEETLEPRQVPEIEEAPREADPLDDPPDAEPVALPDDEPAAQP